MAIYVAVAALRMKRLKSLKIINVVLNLLYDNYEFNHAKGVNLSIVYICEQMYFDPLFRAQAANRVKASELKKIILPNNH